MSSVPPSAGQGSGHATFTMGHARFAVLDGWRGISILLVMACHMLPLGPAAWRLNETAGPLGMSIFFALSGFLITTTLLKSDSTTGFFIRRLLRILPLAFLYLVVVLTVTGAEAYTWLVQFLFLGNYQPDLYHPLTLHFWSLCVELHFYLGIGVLSCVLGHRGLLAIPFGLVAMTIAKAVVQPDIQMQTHLRCDEILAGATLALVYQGRLPGAASISAFLAACPIILPIVILLGTCHPVAKDWQWLRPYAATIMVGCTVFARHPAPILTYRPLRYIAEISYALYVLHPATMAGWLGSGSGWEKYAKRPLCILLSVALAHASTRIYERFFIDLGKRLSQAPRA